MVDASHYNSVQTHRMYTHGVNPNVSCGPGVTKIDLCGFTDHNKGPASEASCWPHSMPSGSERLIFIHLQDVVNGPEAPSVHCPQWNSQAGRPVPRLA